MDNEAQRKNMINDSELKCGHFSCHLESKTETVSDDDFQRIYGGFAVLVQCDNVLIAQYRLNSSANWEDISALECVHSFSDIVFGKSFSDVAIFSKECVTDIKKIQNVLHRFSQIGSGKFIYAEPLSDSLDKFLLQIKEFIIQISFEYEKDFFFDTFGIVEIDNAESTELEAMDSSEKKN